MGKATEFDIMYSWLTKYKAIAAGNTIIYNKSFYSLFMPNYSLRYIMHNSAALPEGLIGFTTKPSVQPQLCVLRPPSHEQPPSTANYAHGLRNLPPSLPEYSATATVIRKNRRTATALFSRCLPATAPASGTAAAVKSEASPYALFRKTRHPCGSAGIEPQEPLFARFTAQEPTLFCM
jgi:hypothetical protein